MNIEYKVEKEDKLIDILRDELNISSRTIRKLKREKNVTVNNIFISLNAILRVNDIIKINIEEKNIFEPEDIDIDILYEDDDYIIVNKPPFIVTYPTKKHRNGTIANAISYYIESKNESYKIRFGNRLDRDTSGIMIICKSSHAQKILQDQKIEKYYYALVDGIVELDHGIINEPIGLKSDNEAIRIVREDGLPSITEYHVIKRMSDKTLLDIKLHTGRTHQIRVHLKHINHPIVSDSLYGTIDKRINRQALHCYFTSFKNTKGKKIVIKTDLPDDIHSVIH